MGYYLLTCKLFSRMILPSRHHHYFKNREFLFSLLEAFFLLAISFVGGFYASIFATNNESSAVTDIILSNIRVYDVDWVFAYGPLIFFLFLIAICLHDPKRIPYTLKSIALFVLVRSVFVTLTHIGAFPVQATVEHGSFFLKYFTGGGDLFFSGHTGLPFLLALLFWRERVLRVLFISTSVLFGIVVLMGHFHYSIDVLAAFFITYTIFHIAEIIFPEDRKLFLHGIEHSESGG